VLAENSGMRGLAVRLGLTDALCEDDRTLRNVTLTL